jgi:hypothetical protein
MLTVNADDLPRLMLCNGSRLMSPSFPEDKTDPTARNEGIAAHWLAAQFFEGVPIETLVDRKAPNGVYIGAEMHGFVDEYLCALDCGEVEADTSYGNDNYRINGRCDHRKYAVASDTLYIDDFKYGWRIVEPERNWTLISHAIATCIFQQITPATIVLRIHQPRPHHPDGKLREWRITYAELMEFYRQIVQTLSNPSNELQTGQLQCVKCPALATCPAAQKTGMNIIDATEVAFNDDPSNDMLSFELDTLRNAKAMLEARVKSLEELATYRLKNGQVILNYATEEQFANTAWKTGLTAAILKMMTGVDLAKDGTVTPAEAKRRGVPETVVKSLTTRPMIGVKLIRASAAVRGAKLLNKG